MARVYWYIMKNSSPQWYVVYTKPRQEIKVAERLHEAGISTFCPTRLEVRQWSDRKKKVRVPLLPSYVFVQRTERDRDAVFVDAGVVRYLYWLGKPAIVRTQEIEALQTHCKADALHVKVEQLAAGDKVLIDNGPFKGHEAEVHQVDGQRIQVILAPLGVKVTFRQTA